jgi:hypothetical protein
VLRTIDGFEIRSAPRHGSDLTASSGDFWQVVAGDDSTPGMLSEDSKSSDRIVGYRTSRNAWATGVTSSKGRGDRVTAVHCILLLVGVLILPLCSIGAVMAEENSPVSPAETSIAAVEKQRALPAWTEGSLYIHHISTGRGNAS